MGDETATDDTKLRSEADDTEVRTSALGNTSGCLTTAATGNDGRTITGGGVFITPATYNPANCSKAYLVDLNNYSTANNLGTGVGYSGPLPTTEAACKQTRMAVFVWQRGATAGTGTFKGSKSVAGRWAIDMTGAGRCILPSISVDKVVSGYRADNTSDYRLALSAWNGASSTPGASDVTQPIGFSAQSMEIPTPYMVIASLAEWRVTFPPPGGAIVPQIHTLWTNRNTAAARSSCRALQLSRTLSTFSAPALVKAGASQASVNAQNSGMTSLYNALCTSSGTEVALQDAARAAVNASMDVFNSMQVTYSGKLGTAHSDVTIANLISQVATESLGDLIARCSLDPKAPMRYVLDGTLPPNVSADRLLLGTCSNQTPTQVSTNLGIGGLFGAQTLRSAQEDFANCLMKAGQDRCNSPVADGATPPANNPDAPTPCRGTNSDGSCTPAERTAWLNANCHGTGPNGSCTTAEATAFEKEVGTRSTQDATVDAAARQATTDTNRGTAQTVLIAIGDLGKVVLAGTAAVKLFIATAADPEPLTKFGLGLLTVAAYGAFVREINNTCDDFPEPCRVLGNGIRSLGDASSCIDANGVDFCSAGKNRMCAPDYGIAGTWYNSSDGTQLDQADRLNSCTCKMLDAAYARVPGVTRLQSVMCPDVFDREKQDCIDNPMTGGPNDGPNPKCIAYVQPANLDDDSIFGRICEQRLRCLDETVPRYDAKTNSCKCITVTPTGANPPCPITPFAMTGLCSPEDPSACFCTPKVTPPPNGGDPLCGINPGRVPGPKDAWSMVDKSTAYLTSFGALGLTGTNANVEALAVRAGGINALATPTLYANSFAQRGTAVRTKVAIRRAPTTGQNLVLQMYYTNKPENVIHAFVGQCSLNGFAVNAVGNCDLTLPTVQRPNPRTGAQENVRIADLGGRYNFEYVFQSPTTYKTRLALGPLSYTGTLTNTPSSQLVGICPTPDPLPTGLPAPLAPITNPSFIDFGPIWTFTGAPPGFIPETLFPLSKPLTVIR